jgi:hypothetical protein
VQCPEYVVYPDCPNRNLLKNFSKWLINLFGECRKIRAENL